MCMDVLSVYVFYATCLCGTHRGQKALDPQELELQTVMGYHVGIKNQTWTL